MSRNLVKIIKNIEQSEGAGAKVRRSIGTSQVDKKIFKIYIQFFVNFVFKFS